MKNSKYITKNRYETIDNITIIYTRNNEKIIVDTEDVKKLKEYTWNLDNNRGYVSSKIHKPDENIKIHRYIMNLKDKNLVVDHINGNKLDNRKVNLRICTHKENMRNSKPYSNNTSGVKGVYIHSQSNKWRATIGLNNKKISLGLFDKKEDAIKARLEAEQIYYGEYSYYNR